MSRRYSTAHKQLVLKLLQSFKGDITATSRYTGVPQRTLREWREHQVRVAAARRQSAGGTPPPSRRQS
jgi:transposase-like protein